MRDDAASGSVFGWVGSAEIVDLSLSIRSGGPTYPGDPLCSIEPFLSIPLDVANVSTISMGSHQGTHLDAPFHFLPDGATIDRIDLAQTTGRAILVDLGSHAPGSMIDIEPFADLDLRPGDRLVYRLGWDRRLQEPGYFTDMPRLSIEAAAFLAGKRLALLGMDAPTPNPVDAVEVHRLLLGAGTVLLEALANLDRLKPGPFWLSAAPLRLIGADGAPVRAIATQQPTP